MMLHEYLRGDAAGLELALDEIESQVREMRRRLADLRELADDVWSLEAPPPARDPRPPAPPEREEDADA
jgi:hypothetical protein